MKKTIYLFCLLIAVTSLQAQQYDHCGTWRWSLKTLTDDKGEEILASTPEKTTINALNALKRPDKVGLSTPRFPVEKKLVTVKGYIIEHKRVEGSKGDHDYHIVVQSPDGKSQLITEIPHPECPEVYANETMYELFSQLRETYNEYIGTPGTKLTALDPPVEVEITGVPFWDMPGHGGGHSENGIEIHPITAIRVINPAAAPVAASANQPFYKSAADLSTPSAPQQASLPVNTTLGIILLGAILGMAGQFLRIIVGIKKAMDSGTETDYKRTLLSIGLAFAIGSVAGILAGLNVVETSSIDKATLLAFVAAGYAGTDFIEGFMRKTPLK